MSKCLTILYYGKTHLNVIIKHLPKKNHAKVPVPDVICPLNPTKIVIEVLKMGRQFCAHSSSLLIWVGYSLYQSLHSPVIVKQVESVAASRVTGPSGKQGREVLIQALKSSVRIVDFRYFVAFFNVSTTGLAWGAISLLTLAHLTREHLRTVQSIS